MVKDFSIIGCIIVVVIIGHIYAQNMLKRESDEISGELISIKNQIQAGNTENINENINKTYENWSIKASNWSILADHQEIDNIEKTIINVKSAIESEDYTVALSKIDESKFLISQIQDKEKIILKNIF